MSVPVERVLCAAIYVDTGRTEPGGTNSYGYPETGLVFCGLRHNDCFVVLNAWLSRLTRSELRRLNQIEPHQTHGKRQGFLTTAGRYVDRREAQALALAAGQVDPQKTIQAVPGDLFSEDLY